MSNKKLDRLLLSVGKGVFVEYFDVFRKCKGRADNSECIKGLARVGGSNIARGTRCSKAKEIFNSKLEKEALKICVNSRIPSASKTKAAALLKQLGG